MLKDGIIDSQICIGDLSGNKDTCQGDSGGPIQVLLFIPYTLKIYSCIQRTVEIIYAY